MEKRHPVLRAVSLALPSALLIAGCVLYAYKASNHVPNGEFREVPSPIVGAPKANLVTATHLKTLALPDSALNLNGQGSVLYAAMTTAGLGAIDISDPYDPEFANHVQMEGPEPEGKGDEVREYVINAFLVEGRLIVLDRIRGLVVYDAADAMRPEFQWSKTLPGSPGHQAIDLEHVGDSLYLASGGAGLLRLDADFDSEGESHPILEVFDHTTEAIFLPPNWMIVTDGRSPGLQIVDIATAASPVPVGSISCWPLYLDNAVLIQNHAFVTTRGDNVVLAFNLTDPSRPYLSNVYRRPFSAIKSVASWRDRYVLVGNHFGFVEVIDAIDPERPVLIALLRVPGVVGTLFVREDAMYVGLWGDDRIEVYRLRDEQGSQQASVRQGEDT